MSPFLASNALIRSSLGAAVISLDLTSVATCASTNRCSEPQALTMCKSDLPLARSKVRRRTMPSMATTPLQLLRELRHKPLKGIAELIRVEIKKQLAEGVVTGQPVGHGEKAAQEWLLGLGKTTPCPLHLDLHKELNIGRSSTVPESHAARHYPSADPQASPNRRQIAPVLLCRASNSPAGNFRPDNPLRKWLP